MPFTKIVATLGPASSAPQQINALMKAGVRAFRLNFSHGTQLDQKQRIDTIRALAARHKIHCAVIADIQGPKLRIGAFEKHEIILKKGQSFRLDLSDIPGNEARCPLPHPEIYRAVKRGMCLLLNDGQIRLQIERVGRDYLMTKVIVGGVLSDHKGVNVPDVALPISALTKKDISDIKFALKQRVDWICLSFVQKPADIKQAKLLIADKAGIIAKIEKPAALAHLDEIIALADGAMVARGDLGVECPIERVPTLQRRIVEACRKAGKPVIVATQMLESMIKAPVPTRAEVSDVATAVYEGADCVMLSAETASGQYPIQAVSVMQKIIDTIQSDTYYAQAMAANTLPPDRSVASAITSGMRNMVRVLSRSACIATYSISGKTTLRAARERIPVPILGLTPDARIADRLALVWGVLPVQTERFGEMTDVSPIAVQTAKALKLARKGDEVIITAGIPFAKKGKTNILHIAVVE